MTTTHTPTPWRQAQNVPLAEWPYPALEAQNGHMIAQMCITGDKGRANRDLILKAVNNHTEMLEALRDLSLAMAQLENLHHAGLETDDKMWSTVYNETGKARTLVARIDKGDA